jgi:transcriptional regulator with XRE-family HTH domain
MLGRMTCRSPARTAREAAGLDLRTAARRARVSSRYLAHVERHGAPFCLAERLAGLYQCRIDAFLPTGGGTSKRRAGAKR